MRKKVNLFLCTLIISVTVSLFLYPEKIILKSGLYNIKNLNYQETFKVLIDPSQYYELNGQKDINNILARRFDTTINFEKISVSPQDNTVNLFIKFVNKWNIFKGEYLSLYKVESDKRSNSFKYDEIDFSFIDSQGKKVPYLQYGMNNNTLIITLDKEIFFKHKGNITLEFKLNNYIKYALWFL